MVKGWAYNGSSHKRHYFDGRISACGRQRVFGKLRHELVLTDDPKNCAGCRREVEKSHEKAAQAAVHPEVVHDHAGRRGARGEVAVGRGRPGRRTHQSSLQLQGAEHHYPARES